MNDEHKKGQPIYQTPFQRGLREAFGVQTPNVSSNPYDSPRGIDFKVKEEWLLENIDWESVKLNFAPLKREDVVRYIIKAQQLFNPEIDRVFVHPQDPIAFDLDAFNPETSQITGSHGNIVRTFTYNPKNNIFFNPNTVINDCTFYIWLVSDSQK